MFTVMLGKLGRDFRAVEVAEDATVREAFEEGGFELSETTLCKDIGKEDVDFSDKVEDGKTYVLVHQVKSA